MAVLQIAADQPGAGKTSLAGGLLLHLAESGKRVGYYKPFSNHSGEDPDVALVTQSLLDAAAASEVPSPLPLLPFTGTGPSLVKPAADEVQRAVTSLQNQCDLVLLEGPDLGTPTGEASPLPLELSSLIDSRVLLLMRYANDLSGADVQRAADPFGDRLAGVLINGVTMYRKREIDQSMESTLAPQGIPFLGTVGEDRGMLGVTVQQIADYLEGRWAQEPEIPKPPSSDS